MVEPKYQLPIWLQTIWGIVAVLSLFVGFNPNFDRLILGAVAALFIFTCIYNKAATGVWAPGAKKNAPKESE
jgi:hypothetical protein